MSDPLPSTAERDQTLWLLVLGPLIWVVHFFVCYLSGALACARAADPAHSLGTVRWIVAVATIVALTGITAVGLYGARRHRLEEAPLPHHHDTPGDRTRFLGFAAVLLASLSGVATLFVGMVALFVETCR